MRRWNASRSPRTASQATAGSVWPTSAARSPAGASSAWSACRRPSTGTASRWSPGSRGARTSPRTRSARSPARAPAWSRPRTGTPSTWRRSSSSPTAASRRLGYDRRRFRPNILIEGVDGAAEQDWIGGRLQVGEALLFVREGCERCVITTIDPDTTEVDPEVLRRARLEVGGMMGVYCSVLEPGVVAVGDPVRDRSLTVAPRRERARRVWPNVRGRDAGVRRWRRATKGAA